MRLTVRVPATVANLGPGFDCLGLALDLVNAVELDTDGSAGVAIDGEGAGELPEDHSNLIVRTMAYLAGEAGGRLPRFSLRCSNRIPLERGLGSSAAAVVAGLLLGNRLLGAGLSDDRVLGLAVDLEGHADNVAAALRGGAVIAYLSSSGWKAEPLEPSDRLRPVLLIPEHERVSTQEARRVLPLEVPRSAASFNVARAALLVAALTRRPELLGEALQDRLHQQARLRLAPASRALFSDLEEAGIPVCVAGSGPTLLAFEDGERTVSELGPGWRVLRVGVRAAGAEIEEA
ncbi:MAG: homoserine kinase [Actinomycetota bacterium]|nr:homoserine kinase [Actinomycetota bacterium]